MMLAGQLAKMAGVKFETLRFYENQGVLPEPRRSGNGYRQYGDRHLAVLLFLKEAKGLGFSLAEIRALVALDSGGNADCRDVADIARAQLQGLQSRIRALRGIERNLKKLVKA